MNICLKCKHLVDVPCDEGTKVCEMGLHENYKAIIKCSEFKEKIV
jgi:hypothetical protein